MMKNLHKIAQKIINIDPGVKAFIMHFGIREGIKYIWAQEKLYVNTIHTDTQINLDSFFIDICTQQFLHKYPQCKDKYYLPNNLIII